MPNRTRRTPPDPLFVTLDEAADLLGVSSRTIRRLIAADALRSRHILSAHRVERASIDEYIERGRTSAAS